MGEKLLIEIDGDVTAIKKKLQELGVGFKDPGKGADDVNKKLEGTKSRLGQIGSGIKAAFGGLNRIGGQAVKAVSAGIGAASASIGALSMTIYNATAEHEQLLGGIETLFGAGGKSIEEYAASVGKSVGEASGEYSRLMTAQREVLKNADAAYRTAGMSANEYMQTATSFSASLLQSLGGDTIKAAKAADQAIIDMADNANKMGTSMESVQNAYQGFAKQNYTMLDNLKLGYGGTKEEMQRLLKDAEAFSGVKYDISSLSDVYEAIHVVQTEMGITGTTAKEAGSTLSGSFGAMKAAWTNLMSGIGSGSANLDQLINSVLSSAETFAGNLMPLLTRAMSGLGSLALQIAPKIRAVIPGLLATIVPQLLSAGVSMATAIVQGLAQAAPTIASAGLDILRQLIAGIQSVVAEIIPMSGTIIAALGEGFLLYQGAVLGLGLQVVVGLVQGLVEAIPTLIPAAARMITGLADGLVTAIPLLAAAIPQLISGVVAGLTSPEGLGSVIAAGLRLLLAIVDAIPQVLAGLSAALPQLITGILTFLLDPGNLSAVAAGFTELILASVEAIPEIIAAIVLALGGIIQAVVSFFQANGGDIKAAFEQIGQDIALAVSGWWTAMKAKVEEIWQNVVQVFTQLWDDLVGHSIVWDIINDVISAFSGWWDSLKGIVEGLVNNIKEKFAEAKDAVVGFFKGIFGGKDEEKDVAVNTEMGVTAGGMTAVDVLSPVPQAVIDSYNALNAALAAVNAEIAALNAALGVQAAPLEGAGGGSLLLGLSAVALAISGTLTTALTNLLAFLSGDVTTGLSAFGVFLRDQLKVAIEAVRDALYVEGGGGNTMANSLGEVLGITESLQSAFLDLISIWRSSFVSAVDRVKQKSGELLGALTRIETVGRGIEAAFRAAAAAIEAVFSLMSGRGNGKKTGAIEAAGPGRNRANAWGGWTSWRGLTLVGERGPELIGTSRMMNVWRSDELLKRLAEARGVAEAMRSVRAPARFEGARVDASSTTNQHTNTVSFGNVYGERYLTGMMERVAERVIRKGVFLGAR